MLMKATQIQIMSNSNYSIPLIRLGEDANKLVSVSREKIYSMKDQQLVEA